MSQPNTAGAVQDGWAKFKETDTANGTDVYGVINASFSNSGSETATASTFTTTDTTPAVAPGRDNPEPVEVPVVMNAVKKILADGLRAGKTRSELIGEMKERGLTIIQAIKATRELFEISLAEAKQAVALHPDWAMVVAANAPLHDELLNAFLDAQREMNETGRLKDL